MSLPCEATPETFFDPRTVKQAKALCATCPVRLPCLTRALEDREQYGVFGGMTEVERARLPVLNGGGRVCALDGCATRFEATHPRRRFCSENHMQRAAQQRYRDRHEAS